MTTQRYLSLHLPQSSTYDRLASKLDTARLVLWIKRDVRMVLTSAKKRVQ